MQLTRGISHDHQGGGGIDESAQVHLAQGNEKAGVDREQQHEIQPAGADQLGKLGAVGQEKGLENLLDEMARPHQQDDLPFGPGGDVIGVQIDDADEAELEGEPKHLDHDPEQEIAFETHFAHDGVAPERMINDGVAPQPRGEVGGFRHGVHPPTAEYLRMPRSHTARASR